MYLFMNKDREIARFTVRQGELGDIYEFEALDTAVLPIGFRYIEQWLEGRKGSTHNRLLRKFMKTYGCDNTETFIRVSHAASLMDSYWIKEELEDLQWSEVSCFCNDFDENVSKSVFNGGIPYDIRGIRVIPELTTDGSFRKCWRREDGGIYLYKGGTSESGNAGLEPYCEVLGSEIAKALSPDAVSYQLVKLHGEKVSRCRLFTTEDLGYVPIARFDLNHGSPEQLFRFYAELGAEDTFRRMIVIDAITCNVDRHAGNHGVLVKNDTQTPVCMAPVFDMNRSMLPYMEIGEFKDIERKLSRYGPRIGEDFIRMGQAALTSEIRSDLINLRGFEFSFEGDDKFPSQRVKALEELVNRRIDDILEK